RNRVQVAGEAHPGELAQEGGLEERLAIVAREGGEVGEVVLAEAIVRDVVDDAPEAAGDGEAALERVAPEEEVEDALHLALARLAVALRHRELVEVGQQGEGHAIHLGQEAHLSYHLSIGSGLRGCDRIRANANWARRRWKPALGQV